MVSLDCAVGRGEGDAGQNIAFRNLVIIKESLFCLINFALLQGGMAQDGCPVADSTVTFATAAARIQPFSRRATDRVRSVMPGTGGAYGNLLAISQATHGTRDAACLAELKCLALKRATRARGWFDTHKFEAIGLTTMQETKKLNVTDAAPRCHRRSMYVGSAGRVHAYW